MLVTFGSFRVKQSSYVELFLSVSQKSRLLRLTRKTFKIVNTCISRSSAEKTEWPSGRVAEWPSGAKLKTAFHWLRVWREFLTNYSVLHQNQSNFGNISTNYGNNEYKISLIDMEKITGHTKPPNTLADQRGPVRIHARQAGFFCVVSKSHVLLRL